MVPPAAAARLCADARDSRSQAAGRLVWSVAVQTGFVLGQIGPLRTEQAYPGVTRNGMKTAYPGQKWNAGNTDG